MHSRHATEGCGGNIKGFALIVRLGDLFGGGLQPILQLFGLGLFRFFIAAPNEIAAYRNDSANALPQFNRQQIGVRLACLDNEIQLRAKSGGGRKGLFARKLAVGQASESASTSGCRSPTIARRFAITSSSKLSLDDGLGRRRSPAAKDVDPGYQRSDFEICTRVSLRAPDLELVVRLPSQCAPTRTFAPAQRRAGGRPPAYQHRHVVETNTGTGFAGGEGEQNSSLSILQGR